MHGFRFDSGDVNERPRASIKLPLTTAAGAQSARLAAEECPVALVYDGGTMAVLMATPADLDDLAIGFSLTEGIVGQIDDIEELTSVPGAEGIELRMWLRPDAGRLLKQRRRNLVGPTGCGLCGIESLHEATRPARAVQRGLRLTAGQIRSAMETMAESQVINRQTHATHAAGFFMPGETGMIVREDVGRHNALDKLAGALAKEGINGQAGAIVLTSRIAVDMVQKAAAIGSGILIAISAPTALAVRTAEACGITLVGIARGADFEIFSHPDGIALENPDRPQDRSG